MVSLEAAGDAVYTIDQYLAATDSRLLKSLLLAHREGDIVDVISSASDLAAARPCE